MCKLNADLEEADASDTKGELSNPYLLSVNHQCLIQGLPIRRKTMMFHGSVGKQEVLILLDSGSVATFISDTLASQLQCDQQACDKIQYSRPMGIHKNQLCMCSTFSGVFMCI
jgi:hypothetical protein